jgi:hypothetical protein
VVWTEPPPKASSTARRAGAAALPTKVAVVYYLSRNGQLDHPHFMEVALSSPQDGLCLRGTYLPAILPLPWSVQLRSLRGRKK